MSYVTHANAKLTPAGRLAMVRAVVEKGWTQARVAERFQVAWGTVSKRGLALPGRWGSGIAGPLVAPASVTESDSAARGYCRIKQWRGLATRYDKHAVIYRAAVVLNAVIAWAKALSDTP